MLVALSDFTAMTGFRDPDSAAGTFEQIAQMVDNTELTGVLTAMAEGLRAGELIEVFGQLVDPDGPFWQPDGFTAEIFAAVQRSGTDDKYLVNAHEAAVIHPNDPGALVTLLMNLILGPRRGTVHPLGDYSRLCCRSRFRSHGDFR